MKDLKKALLGLMRGLPRPDVADPKVIGMIKKGKSRAGKKSSGRKK